MTRRSCANRVAAHYLVGVCDRHAPERPGSTPGAHSSITATAARCAILCSTLLPHCRAFTSAVLTRETIHDVITDPPEEGLLVVRPRSLSRLILRMSLWRPRNVYLPRPDQASRLRLWCDSAVRFGVEHLAAFAACRDPYE